MTPPGLVSGRYRIIRPLSAGGMSRVWLASDEASTAPIPPLVVVKQCTVPEGLAPPQRAVVHRWALHEAEAAARLLHPNLIHTYRVLPDRDGPWIVMEYLPSRSLQEIVEDSGALPPARVAEIGLAVLAALKAVRRAGLLHLDVKPGNVLVTADGRVVLTDFGPAVSPAGIAALARAGVVLGSPKYIAPERLFERVSDERSDLWSLGATLYHAVEGRPPFVRENTTAILRALADSLPDPPRQAGLLTPVLTGLLRRNPADRLTAAEVEVLLGKAARPQHAVARRPRRAVRRRVTALAAAGTVLITLASVAASAQGGQISGTPQAVAPLIATSDTGVTRPADFVWWVDPSGFRVALPQGWKMMSGPDGSVVFADPRGGPTLQVTRWPKRPKNLVAALLAEEQKIQLEAYRRLRIEALATPPGAIWEYTFLAAGEVSMRGLRRVIGTAGQTYQLEWRTDRAGWVDGLPRLTVVLNSFSAMGS
ncbi:serine/threonine protein kinase [Actinoplanes sp. NBC_00393]|uniref:serine/threonine-protein kinase n=1 Tax=Actinoplanes sp. NBC_00393 TaxID=2975953 RepID=UPI002E228663